MNAILRKLRKDESGASSIIEMTLIFPLVLFVMGFLIYLGSYVMQSVTIYNDAQRIAVAASREAGLPGYLNLYGGDGMTTTADFNLAEGTAPARDLINAFMKKHEPYRYWGNNFLSASEKKSLETNLEQLVASNSFLAPSNVDCTITTSNNILNQKVQVRVVKYISAPQLFRALGLADNINIDVTATAVVGDPAEFVRNTDMVMDLVDYLMNDLKIGTSNQTINERIAIYKQKFSDVCAKIGVSW